MLNLPSTLDLDLMVSLGYQWFYEYFKRFWFVNRLSVYKPSFVRPRTQLLISAVLVVLIT